MADGFPGDATKEDIEKVVRKEVRGALTGASEGNPITISAAGAAMLLALLPPAEDDEETPKKVQAPKQTAAEVKAEAAEARAEAREERHSKR